MSARSLAQKRSPGAAGRGAAFTPDLNTRPPIRAFYGLRDLHHQPMQREAQSGTILSLKDLDVDDVGVTLRTPFDRVLFFVPLYPLPFSRRSTGGSSCQLRASRHAWQRPPLFPRK